MLLTDLDGDTLEIKEVYSFGPPVLTFWVSQNGEESGVVITRDQVIQIVEELNRWLKILVPRSS